MAHNISKERERTKQNEKNRFISPADWPIDVENVALALFSFQSYWPLTMDYHRSIPILVSIFVCVCRVLVFSHHINFRDPSMPGVFYIAQKHRGCFFVYVCIVIWVFYDFIFPKQIRYTPKKWKKNMVKIYVLFHLVERMRKKWKSWTKKWRQRATMTKKYKWKEKTTSHFHKPHTTTTTIWWAASTFSHVLLSISFLVSHPPLLSTRLVILTRKPEGIIHIHTRQNGWLGKRHNQSQNF